MRSKFLPEKSVVGDVVQDPSGRKYKVTKVGLKFLHVVPIEGGEECILNVLNALKPPQEITAPSEETRLDWEKLYG